MAFGTGQIIENEDYNTVYNRIRQVYGRTDSGYGMPMYYEGDNPRSNNETIYALEWQNLRSYVLRSRIHQIGTSATLNAINAGDVIHYANHLGQINTMSTACVTDNRTVHSTQISIEDGKYSSGNIFTGWGSGSANRVLTNAASVTGANANGDGEERGLRYFFNSGGKVKIRSTLTGGTGTNSKTEDWRTFLSNMGTISINHNSVSGAGNAITPPAGFYAIGSSDVQIYKRFTAAGTVYSENYFTIYARRETGKLILTAKWVDDDAGDQRAVTSGIGPAGPGEDEGVFGTINLFLDQERATGDNVSVPTPTYATSTNWAVGSS